MDTVLITGGCGYIGSHTCVSFLENKLNVLLIDSLVNSYENNFHKIKSIFHSKGLETSDRIQFIKGDIRNTSWLEAIFEEYKYANRPIKNVIHFAGLKSIYCSIKSPLEYWDANVSGTLSLLSTMRKYDCFDLIFSSSATVYNPNVSKLLKETDELKPSTPYGKTKLCIEEILNDIFQSDHNWRIANLRYFNPVGAHKSGSLCENSRGISSNLFPAILRTLRGHQDKLMVFGNDWPTFDGTCIRDYIHVMDLAEAHIATLDYLKQNTPQNISINIGTGRGTSVLEVLKTFHQIKDIHFDYEFVDRRPGDQPFVVADNKLALELLDWLPRRSLIDMCEDSIINI